MKPSITLKLLLNSPLFKKSILAGFTLWLILIVPISIASWFFLNKYEYSKLQQQRLANESILANVFSANARYGDFVNARGFVLEKARPLGLSSITICNKDKEVLQKINLPACPPRNDFVAIVANGIELQLVFNWNENTSNQSTLILISLAISIFLSAFFIFSSAIITYAFTVKRLQVFSNDLSILAASDGIPNFPFFPEAGPIVDSLKLLKNKIIVMGEENLQMKTKAVFSDLARQVAHDIRSPLSALTMLSDAFNSVPEEKRLIIRGAIQRINDIANDLLQKSKEKATESHDIPQQAQKTNSVDNLSKTHTLKTQIELTPAVVDLIVSEKRIQYRDKIDVEIISDFSNSYGDFVEINANELKRVLSNLINNSVEAFLDAKGKVMVSIQSDNSNVSIIVRDNGRGIPEHILAKLGEKGVSHGKEGTASGSGLGIYHAKQSVESFIGKFEIQSKRGLGTTITMNFPKAAVPNWFVEKLVLKTNMHVISLDDDLSIHQIWKGRLQSLNADSSGITHLSFTSGQEFKNYVESHANDKSIQKIYLVDFELLNQNMTGLDLIEDLGLGNRTNKAVLVSSRYEESTIRNRCAKIGVKLIPKGMAGFVPIEIEKPKEKYDALLIDDDDLIHMTWQIVAKDKNKTIKLLKTEAEFLAIASEVDPATPVYIDVHLAENVNGIEVAKRIYELGFLQVYLATGYTEIQKPSFIEAIVGKEPKF